LSRRGRDQRRVLPERLESDTRRAVAARDRFDEVAGRVQRLRDEQEEYGRFETTEWAELAQQASVVLDQVHQAERHRAARQRTPSQWQQPRPWIDRAAEREPPGISL
jgi:hypothetical protein